MRRMIAKPTEKTSSLAPALEPVVARFSSPGVHDFIFTVRMLIQWTSEHVMAVNTANTHRKIVAPVFNGDCSYLILAIACKGWIALIKSTRATVYLLRL